MHHDMGGAPRHVPTPTVSLISYELGKFPGVVRASNEYWLKHWPSRFDTGLWCPPKPSQTQQLPEDGRPSESV